MGSGTGNAQAPKPGMGSEGLGIQDYAPTGGLNNAYAQSEKANDVSMGMGNTTQFGGQDVNLNSAYADQKSNSGNSDWKEKMKKALYAAGTAQLNDYTSAYNTTPSTFSGGGQEGSVTTRLPSNSEIYNQLVQNNQVRRYKNGVQNA